MTVTLTLIDKISSVSGTTSFPRCAGTSHFGIAHKVPELALLSSQPNTIIRKRTEIYKITSLDIK